MKTRTLFLRCFARPAAGAAVLLALPLVSAQQTATTSTDVGSTETEIVTLSPFQVTTERDQGYAATNSVSGSRVNTAIKEIPISIQVITSEFIKDTGATDLTVFAPCFSIWTLSTDVMVSRRTVGSS